jgi:pimeloyl-ACP methyl ester carboxylesterase
LVDAGFRCIAPDLRGFGESDKPPNVQDYGLPLVLQDVIGIMDELKAERATVVGHDWGAGVGWLLASFSPDRVERLIALSVGHPSGFRQPFLSQLQKSWYMFFFQFRELAEEALQANDWELMKVWLDGAPDAERSLEELSRPGALTAGLNWYRANFPPEALVMQRAALPTVEVPVTGVWGAGDSYLTEELMTRSEEYVSGEWRYERFEGSGHWIPLDDPDRLNRLIVDAARAG